jgi:VanZ family protein
MGPPVLGPRSSRLLTLTRVVFGVALAATAWTSLLPPEDVPPAFGLSDKVIHAIGYAVLGFLAVASRISWPRAWLLVVGFGVLLEFAQGIAGYRSFEVADMVADAVGASIGVAIAILTFSARSAWSRARR